MTVDGHRGILLVKTDPIIDSTRRWLERAVLGLGLCPFAESVYRAHRVRFRVSEQSTPAGVRDDLCSELKHLAAVDAAQCETTLLIHPWALNDFLEFNDFLQVCDDTLIDLELEGEIQIASFHPRYQFAGSGPDDIENHTNRAPYPTLHLLREASVERAVAGVADPDAIYERNILRMRELGAAGWTALWDDEPGPDSPAGPDGRPL